MNIYKNIFLQGSYQQQKYNKCRQPFTIANNMNSPGLWGNVILTKINGNIDSNIGCAKRIIQYQEVRHQICDVAEPITYLLLML